MNNLNSFRRASMLGLLAGTLVLAFAVPSFAGGTANNPDLVDIDDSLNATSGSALDTNQVVYRTGQSADYYSYNDANNSGTPGTYLKGYAFNYDSEAGVSVDLMWFAFEPDSVKRTDAGASIRQKSNIALGVLLSTATGIFRTDVIEGCSAKGKIKFGSTTKASASLKCPKTVWEDLGFTANQIEAIQSALGSTKIKFGFKGNLIE